MSSAGAASGLVVALVASALGAGASGAHATPGQPGWLEGASSVHADPVDVVAAAPEPEELLEVVVTTATASGPQFTTVPADDVAEAEEIVEEAQEDPATDAVSMASPAQIAATDTHRPQQWALDTLRAESFRAMARGNGVVVAVVDTGVQANHPDLAGRVMSGIRTVPGSGTADDHGHGTHVAGIIAAVAGNGRGVAGLADRARILPVKVFGADGRGSSTDIARGVTAAVNAGAQVINLSLTVRNDDPALRSAVAYAVGRGVIVVAAAGNSPCPLLSPVYPADLPDVLGVGAMERGNAVSSFLCRGGWVDISAPGGSVLSTWTGGGYRFSSGTSMAAPHVAAVAAALIERIGPGWTRQGVESVLRGTATDRGPAGLDVLFGAGVVDPLTALRRVTTETVFSVPTSAVRAGATVPVAGQLRTADKRPLARTRATLTATIGGAARRWDVTSDGAGRFQVPVALRHTTTFRAVVAGASAQRRGQSDVTVKVKPRLGTRTTGRSAVLTVTDAQGQKVSLQRKDGRRWVTTKSTRVRSDGQRWSVRPSRGTWRFVSHGTSRLSQTSTAAWRVR